MNDPGQAPAIAVSDNREAHRFEALVGGHLARIEYDRRHGYVVLIHTEVPPELEGRGVASAMARFALDQIRTEGLRVVPLCPYIRTFIARHPEYRDLVLETGPKSR